MYRDFQFYDSRIVDYTRIGETLTLFCVYGIHEKWRTCFYRVKDLVGEDFLVGSVISFFGYEHPNNRQRCISVKIIILKYTFVCFILSTTIFFLLIILTLLS